MWLSCTPCPHCKHETSAHDGDWGGCLHQEERPPELRDGMWRKVVVGCACTETPKTIRFHYTMLQLKKVNP